jgi:Na+/H+ antiporter NhaB
MTYLNIINIIAGVIEIPVGIMVIKNRVKITKFLDEKLGNHYRNQVEQVARLHNVIFLPFFRILPWFFGIGFVFGGLLTLIGGIILH